MDITELLTKYIALRDRKAEINNEAKQKVAALDAALDKAEAVLLQFFETNGMDSVSCAAGTAYSQTRTSATVADWEACLGFIKENEAWHMLERRVAKLAVEEYVAAEGDLPPGINYRAERIVNVRRS